MPEKEYIEREAVWNALNEMGGCGAEAESWADGWDKAINAAIRIVEKLPSADVAPVRHGRWVKEKTDVLIHWHCSVCEECFFLDKPNSEYCPHCGAKMDEEDT